MIAAADITGLVLCGGRGSRMGGLDKGLQDWQGEPLVRRALDRLAPQVGRCAINANRNLDRYATFGVPVWPDPLEDFPGPLAGLLAGLAMCETPWLLTVPCDAPLFPRDLAARLALAIEAEGAQLAIASCDGLEDERLQPVFCLMHRSLQADLRRYLDEGGRKVERWTARQRRAVVAFDEAAAFANVNTLAELRQLQAGRD